MYTLTQSIQWAQSFIEYAPMTAGTNNEPAVSIGTMVRNTILSAPFTWAWNRAIDTSLTISATTQDYTVNLTDFGYLEKVTLRDVNGNVSQIQDVYNTEALGLGNLTSGRGQRPNAVAVLAVTYGTSVQLRFLGVPDQTYTVTLIYQKLAIPFGSYGVTSVANAAGASLTLTQVTVAGASTTYTGTITGGGANAFVGMTFPITGFANSVNNITITVTASTATTLVCTTTAQTNETHAGAAAGGQAVYTGVFTSSVFPAGAVATITGFVNTANNGSFSVVFCSATRLVVVNASAVSQSATASAFNGNWAPIPDSFMDIFNNLFIAEAFQSVDDWQVSGQYRIRGVAALLSKSEGLTDMQKSDFLAQYLSRDRQTLVSQLRTQLGNQSRGV